MTTDHSTDRDAFGNWLSGFTDGEGCFQLSRYKKSRTTTVVTPRATFSIELRSDDRSTLELIRDFWGIGFIYDGKTRSRRWDSCLTSKYQVTKATDLIEVVIPHFEKFPLIAKKKRDFLIWREGVKLLDLIVNHRTRHYSYRGARTKWKTEEYEQFDSLIAALKEQRRFRSPPIETLVVASENKQFKIRYLFE